jgi:hypothetical protein
MPPSVDQLLGREAGPRTQVGEVTLDGVRPNADEPSRLQDGSACRDEGGENVHLALSRGPGECAAEVPVPHALRAVAARESLGVRLIIRKCTDC